MHRVRTCITVTLLLAVSGCGSGAADPPAGLRVQGLIVDSRAVHRKMAVKVVLPAGDPRGRPLLVFLHGRGDDESSYLHGPLFDALKALGRRAPIVAFPDGADDKYWHDEPADRGVRTSSAR